jgi:predicted PurR-regulated permease PerM
VAFVVAGLLQVGEIGQETGYGIVLLGCGDMDSRFMNGMPVTARRALEILGILAVGTLIVLGQDVIMPLLMAFFISLLLLPMFRWLRCRKVPEVLAIVLCIFAFLLVVLGIAAFLSYQIGMLVKDIEAIQTNLTAHWNKLSGWINEKMHFTTEQQLNYLRKQTTGMSGNVIKTLQGAAVSVGGLFLFVGLVPIYIFLIIFYRHLLLRFVYLWFEPNGRPVVESAMRETEVIVKYYLVGLLIQIGYLTVLVSGILAIAGVKHAILIGVTFAILNLIPYLGALIGNIIGVVLTLTSSQELGQVWIVLGTIAFVQFLDNNILMPRIVGSKVKINALASIVGIVIGGSMAGISGMFLSLPVMAVLKIMFDKSDSMRQWGVLLGDARPEDGGKKETDKSVSEQLTEKRDEEVDRKAHERTGK